jgi:hypothetical protein
MESITLDHPDPPNVKPGYLPLGKAVASRSLRRPLSRGR